MDSNTPDFKKLWSSQTTAAPDLNKIREQVSTLRKKVMKRTIITNVMLLATSAFIIYVWIHFQPEYLSTKLGIVITIAAMVVFLIMLNIMSAGFNSGDENQSSVNYLNTLLQLKKRQRFMHTTMTNLYFLLLGTGIGLYMFEYTSRMSILGGVATYGITAGWMIFNWIYFRPRQIRKQQAQLDQTIEKVESVIKQMNQA